MCKPNGELCTIFYVLRIMSCLFISVNIWPFLSNTSRVHIWMLSVCVAYNSVNVGEWNKWTKLHMAVMALGFHLVRICQTALVLYRYSTWIWCTELVFLKKNQYVSISEGASIISLFLKNVQYLLFVKTFNIFLFLENFKYVLMFVEDSISFLSRRKLLVYLWRSFSAFLFLKKFKYIFIICRRFSKFLFQKKHT
jgi:hypothetical protein